MKKLLLLFLYTSCLFSEEPRKTICLSMIVKNEKDVIKRCLASVKPFIDYWVIFDTGSSDGTQEIIKEYLKDVPGELYESPWVNFAHNRNEALAISKTKADYSLFIDADEYWECALGFSLKNLDKDCYYITMRKRGENTLEFKRTALVDNHLEWMWEGVLHETPHCPHMKRIGFLKNVINFFTDEGARAKDPQKYLKDARLLEDLLEKEPDNSRHVFYLGQSYLLAGEDMLARKSFEKRAAMVSNNPAETYTAMYVVARLQEKAGELDKALEGYFKAHQFRPSRAEPLYWIASIYRRQENYLLAYLVSKYGSSISYPEGEMLYVEYPTYEYGMLLEYANNCFLLGKVEEGLEVCNRILAKPNVPEDIKRQVISNSDVARRKVLEAKWRALAEK